MFRWRAHEHGHASTRRVLVAMAPGHPAKIENQGNTELFFRLTLANNPLSGFMMRYLLPTLTLLLLLPLARAQDNSRPKAFDQLQRAYAPYLDSKDPLAFPAKVRSLAADRYAFWRGAKDVYFLW